jgi:hypothetical protein
MKIWSEVPVMRAREVTADVATWAWVSLWTIVGWRLYSTIAGFAEVGRTIGRGGSSIQDAGRQVGELLGGVPLIGQRVGGITQSAFDAAGEPFVFVGSELEQLLLLVAALLGLIVLAVALVPWLLRYVPWRARRLAELRDAHQALRIAPRAVTPSDVERVLAARAIHRLPYGELLAHTDDPLGDFVEGRFDRLARAELESVGLRP